MGRLLVLALLATACVKSATKQCADGRTCGASDVCDDIHGGCVAPEQLTVCAGMPDAMACDVNGAPFGVCRDGVCLAERCGDGLITGAEECDGDDLGGATCIDRDFYAAEGLACSPRTCTYDERNCTLFCGDGDLNGEEVCDGRAPAATCMELGGFDIGMIGCTGGCAPDFGGCGRFGFVDMPSAETRDFIGIWGTGPKDVFAVGQLGTITHYDGVWKRMDSPILNTSIVLRGVWGSSSTDVFAVGDMGTILHWNGVGAWTMMSSGTTQRLQDVWGSGPNDVWAVGAVGTILHYNGSSWSTVLPNPSTIVDNLNAIAGNAANDVFAVGNAGRILHFDGTDWEPMTSNTGFNLIDVWGTAYDKMTAVGGDSTRGKITRFDGNTWNGPTYTTLSTLNAVWGVNPSNVYMASGGIVLHYDGTTLRPFARALHTLQGLWGSSGEDIFSVGNTGTILHSTGTSWWQTGMTSTIMNMRDVFALSETDVYAVGDGGRVLRYDGVSTSPFGAWNPMAATGIASSVDATGIWGTSASDLYVVASDGVHRYFGNDTWSLFLAQTGLAGIWGSGSTFFIVGASGTLQRYDGVWTPLSISGAPVASPDLNAVWGSSLTDVYAAGEGGTLVHDTGSGFRQVNLMFNNGAPTYHAIGGSGPNDVYVVGSAGAVVHFNGSSWENIPVATGELLHAVVVTRSKQVVVAGSARVMRLRSGGQWIPIGTDDLASVLGGVALGDGARFVGSGTASLDLRLGSMTCIGPEESCTNYWDDDCDGMADACDTDCAGKGPSEQCANGRDDDCDGMTDCQDSDCANARACDG